MCQGEYKEMDLLLLERTRRDMPNKYLKQRMWKVICYFELPLLHFVYNSIVALAHTMWYVS